MDYGFSHTVIRCAAGISVLSRAGLHHSGTVRLQQFDHIGIRCGFYTALFQQGLVIFTQFEKHDIQPLFSWIGNCGKRCIAPVTKRDLFPLDMGCHAIRKICFPICVLPQNPKASCFDHGQRLIGPEVIGLHHAAVVGNGNPHDIDRLIFCARITGKEQAVNLFICNSIFL